MVGAELSWENIQRVHRCIVEGLSISSDFRSTMAMAAGNDPSQVYALPEKIESKLETLISFTNQELASAKALEERLERLEQCIVIASLFCCEFLKIHPFINGNGRTARILLSWILRDQLVVPLTLTCDREEYLDAVHDGQWNGRPPYLLCALVAKCAWLSAENALFLFGD